MIIFVINGPNLNLLGQRPAHIYGELTLEEIQKRLESTARELDVELRFIQSNSEGAIVDAVQRAGREGDGIIINPAAYTHYSIAVRDALEAVSTPALEVHISSIYAREEFRRVSVTAPACRGGVWGLGADSYVWALHALVSALGE